MRPCGEKPEVLVVNEVTNRIYVANEDSSSISVINGTTNTVLATITDEELADPHGIAVNEVTNKIYVSSDDNESVVVINGSDNSILTHIHVDNHPFGLGIDEDTNTIYATLLDHDFEPGTHDHLVSIDGETNEVFVEPLITEIELSSSLET